MSKKNKDGFTLIELLFCIAIVSILTFGIGMIFVLGHFICKFW